MPHAEQSPDAQQASGEQLPSAPVQSFAAAVGEVFEEGVEVEVIHLRRGGVARAGIMHTTMRGGGRKARGHRLKPTKAWAKMATDDGDNDDDEVMMMMMMMVR